MQVLGALIADKLKLDNTDLTTPNVEATRS
jgi:hypothetical protein